MPDPTSMNSALLAELDAKHDAIGFLCRKHGVVSLDLFGSGTTDDWHAESDLDFIVVFQERSGPGLADRYLGLAEDLEALFGRPVDLLTPRSIRNPYLQRAIDATRASVYAE
jgi:uncharacterized protein